MKVKVEVGDTVQIMNPILIKRIGYDYTHEDAKREIIKKYQVDINKFINQLGFRQEKTRNSIVSALAYELVSRKFNNGNERKIFDKLVEDMKEIQAVVLSKRTVKTGTYFPPRIPPSYWDADSYEPGGLKNVKIHVILELDYCYCFPDMPISMYTLIEQHNVTKVNK